MPDGLGPKNLTLERVEHGTPDIVPTVVVANSATLQKQYRVIRFRNRAMVEVTEPYPHFVPLHKDRFERLAYPLLGGVSRSRMNDVFAYLCNTTPDYSAYQRYVAFGLTRDHLGNVLPNHVSGSITTVWDMDTLSSVDVAPEDCIWRSPYAKVSLQVGKERKRIPFVMSLAGGDEGLYDDIMQSIAPLVMNKKPDGVIWWVGDGANGKSTLMDALWRIFPGQLASITVKRLTDGRDTPSLNGTLGNVVKESSEGRVEDTEIYKNIGTHENFRVHKFHSQDDIEIEGNLHHIFSANQIPSFNDKGFAARRRTFIIPFTQRFESNPNFEATTFNAEMFGQLVMEMCAYAVQIKRQGYRYKWSAKTLAAKAGYDVEASNAEEYARQIIAEGVVGFESFNPARIDYENWCGDNGYVPLGISNLRRALAALGFERRTGRSDGEYTKYYCLPNVNPSEFITIGMMRQGLYTTHGFRPAADEDTEPKEPATTILGKDW